MQHKKYIIMLIAMLSLLAIFTTSMTFVFSQAPGENLPTVIAPTEIPATATALAELALTQTADIKSRDWSDFRVAYFVDTSVELDEIVSAETIQQLTGAVVIDSAEAFAEANAEAPFQIVLIHGSMKAKVDREWAKQTYREASTIFIAFDLRFNDLAEIVGDQCERTKNDLLDYVPHAWSTLGFKIYGVPKSQHEQVYRSALENCDNTKTGYYSKWEGMSILREEPEWKELDWKDITLSVMTFTYTLGFE
jgi:hypothetical protein